MVSTVATPLAEARARPILGEVCAQIADVQVRTTGGAAVLQLG